MSSFNDFTILLLITHVMGDFHLQSESLARKKKDSIKYLLPHVVIHFVLLIIPLLLSILNGMTKYGLIAVATVIISHYIMDYFKIKLNKKYKDKDKLLFIIDQIVHISVILLIGEILLKNTLGTVSIYYISRNVLNWILLLLLITKPANIIFKISFNKYEVNKNDSKDEEDLTVPGAGALIGSLERILSVIFLAINSISAIGLIYTAKSIARFKQIELNRQFAEYYLIGTLYSILYALVSYYLVIVL